MKKKISDIKYYSVNVQNIDHPSNDSAIGVCCIEMILFLLSFIFIGPLVILYIVVLIVIGIIRSANEFLTCCLKRNKMLKEEFGELLSFEEVTWIENKNASILAALIMSKPITVSEIKVAFEKKLLNCHDTNKTLNKTVKSLFNFPVFFNGKWIWKEDCDFSITNHVFGLDVNLASLSEILSHVSSIPYNASKPLWNVYVVNCPVVVDRKQESIFTEVTEKEPILSSITEEVEPNSTIIIRIHSSMVKNSSIMEILAELINDKPEHINNIKTKKRFLWKQINALFYFPLLFIKKWSLKNIKSNPRTISNSLPNISTTDQFVFHRFSLADIRRLQLITRATFTEIVLSLLTSSLKQHNIVIRKHVMSEDKLCLLTVNLGSTSEKLSFCDISLPLSTEGMLPIVWDIKRRVQKLKSQSDYIFLRILPAFLSKVLSMKNIARLYNLYINKSQLLVTSIKGTHDQIVINGNSLTTFFIWFPATESSLFSTVCLSYHEDFIICLHSSISQIVDPNLLIKSMKLQMKHFCKLLENRRVPTDKSKAEDSDLDIVLKNDETINLASQSFEESLDQLNRIQIKLQNPQAITDDEKEQLKKKYSLLFASLKAMKQKKTHLRSEEDEDHDEDILAQRRSSLPSTMNREIKKFSRQLSFPKIVENNQSDKV